MRDTPTELRRTVAAIVTSVTLLAVLALWDHQREAESALENFASDQVVVARSLASRLAAHMAELRRDVERFADENDAAVLPDESLRVGRRKVHDPAPPDEVSHVRISLVDGEDVVDVDVPVASLIEDVAAFSRPGQEAVVLLLPGEQSFQTLDGRRLEGAPLALALERGETAARLTKAQAAALGLPPRVAVAGFAPVDIIELGRFGVGYVVTAERLRDREEWGRTRLLLGFLATAGLVMAFGAFALRRQRRALALGHALAVAEVERELERRLESANRAATLGTLAMGIAHELATPASVIKGRAEQLLAKIEDARHRAALAAIVDQANGIAEVVKGFLRLARGDAPATATVEIAALVKGAFELVKHRFQKAGVALLSASLSTELPALVGDARLLEHALVNLLLNACDACETGGVVVVSAAVVGDNVEISVADDGRGISDDDLAHVTDAFFTTKDIDKGSGLGLAISTEIVRAHRGSLKLAPHHPRGTTATLVLPVVVADEPRSAR